MKGLLNALSKAFPAYAVEIFLGLTLILLANFAFFPGQPGFLQAALHPFWIVVLLIAVQYGMPAGLLAGASSAGVYLMFLFHGWPSRTLLETAAEQQQLWLPIAFLLTGTILGEIRHRKILEEKELASERAHLAKQISQIESTYEASERSRRILEARIVGQATTIRTVHDAVHKLQSFQTADIYSGCLDILLHHFQITKSSFYQLDGDYFVLKASRGWEGSHVYEGKVEKTRSLMQFVLTENRMLTIRDLLALKEASDLSAQFGDVLAMFPVRNMSGHIQGVINLEKMDFLSFNKSNFELISLVADWTSQALIRIESLQKMRAQIIRDPEENVFTFSYLQECLNRELMAHKDSRRNFTLSLVQIRQFGFFEDATQIILKKTFVAALRHALPETSLVFKYRFDGIYAVLTPEGSDEILNKALQEVEEIMKKFSAPLKTVTLRPETPDVGISEFMKKASESIGLPQ